MYVNHSTHRQTLISFQYYKFEVLLFDGFTLSLFFSESCWLRYFVPSSAESFAHIEQHVINTIH